MKLNEAIETQALDKLKQTWMHIDKVLLSILFIFLFLLSAFSALAQAPSIVSLEPAHLSDHVERNIGTLTMHFNEPVFEGELGESYDHFRLRRLYTSTDIQTFEVDDPAQVTISGSTVTLKNVQTLDYGESYYISWPQPGILKDADENGLPSAAGNTTWSFTTQKSDLLVTSTFPANGAQFVEPDATTDFVITFNQDVTGTTKQIRLREVGETSSTDYWYIGNSSYVTIDGNTVTLHRNSRTMDPGKDYYIYTQDDPFRDSEGRYFEGIDHQETDFWYFSTKTETTPPGIKTLIPANEEQGVDRTTSTFSIQFDEAVSLDTKGSDVVLYHREGKGNNTPVGSTDYRGISYIKGSYHITFSGLEGLQSGAEYFVAIPDDLFYDSQQNYFEGTDETNWRFLGNRKPTKITLNGSTVLENQPAGTVVGTVSGTDSDNGDQTTITLVGGTHVSSFEIVGNQLRTTEELDYEAGTTRSITLRATDNAGEYINSAFAINVGDVDDTPPILTTADPADGATGVDIRPTLTYTFNENIAITDAVTSTFYLRPSAGGNAVASWQATPSTLPAGMSIVGNQMIFEVATTLAYSTSYYISAPAIADLAGNEASAFSNESFTTRAISSEKEVLGVTIPGIVGDPVIDNENNTITATVQAINPSRLDVDFDLSPGASASFHSNPQYYQNGVPFPFTLRAEDNSFESWTITLNWEGLEGSYTVGENGVFTTITDAINQVNLAGMSNDVTFEVEDGYNVTKTVFLSNPDPSHKITIRPQADATQIDLYPESNFGSVFRFNSVVSNMVIDGADPSTGNVVMNLNANLDGVEGINLFGSGAYDLTLQNLRFNILNSAGIRMNSQFATISGIHIIGCEFVAANTATDAQIMGVDLYVSTISNINVIGNKFYNKAGAPDPYIYYAISVGDALTDVINNSISIRGNRTSGIGNATNILHNSIHVYGTSTESNESHNAISRGTNIQNNNVSMTRTSGSGSYKGFVGLSSLQAEDAGNNVYIADDGVSTTGYAQNATTQSALSAIAPTTTYVNPQFTNASTADLSLTGSSLEESALRSTPVDGVNEDILGNSRSSVAPSKGAYEVPNRASDFLTFSIPQQLSDAIIDKTAHTVTVAVNAGTSLTNLVPTFTISPGASVDKASGDEQDFTSPVSYFIQDEQEYANQEWEVTVSEQNLPPTDIALSPSSIDENEEAGTVVGVLSASDPNGDEIIFSIIDGDNSQHGDLFEIDDETNELKSKEPFDFEQNEELFIRIEADDQAGETVEAALVITVNDVDEIAPAIFSMSPEAEDVDVALTASFTITYDEPIQEGTGSYMLRTIGGQLVGQPLDVLSNDVVVSGSTVTITPSNNLLYNQSYYVEAAAGVVQDALGNPAPAIAELTWHFHTETIITSLSPADEADHVSPFAELVITFDEPVAKQTGGVFRMFRKSDDVQVGVDWSFNGAIASSNTITYDIPIDLEPGVEVYVNIIGGIEDASGNPIDIVGKDTWNFTPVIQSQTVTLNEIDSKTYGAGPFNFTPATSTSGQVITYTSSNHSVATLSNNLVTIHGAGETTIRATQAGNTYYEPAFAEQTFTVDKAPQSITFLGPANMTYGDENHVLNGSVIPSDDDVIYEIIAGDAVEIDQEELELVIVGTGEVTIRATGSEAANYLAPNPVERTFQVYKKTITAQPNDEYKVYGQSNPAFSLFYTDLAYGETADVIDTDPEISTDADESSPVGEYDITLDGGMDDNYAFQLEDGVLEITKKTLTTKANDAGREYGDANPAFSFSFEGFVPGDDAGDLVGTLPSITTSALASSPVGTYDITVANDGVDANYEFEPANGTLTIVKAEIDVFVQSTDKNYGDDNPTFEMMFEGIKNGESSAVFTAQPILTTSATKYSDAGSYAIEASGAEAQNYSFDYDNATLTIHKVIVDATIQDAEWTYGQPSYNFEIVYDGFIAGESEADLDNTPVVTTDANEFSDVDTYDLIVEGHEDTNYDVMFTDGTLTINPAQQVVVIEDITDKVKNAAPFDIIASVNSNTELQYLVEGEAAEHDGKTITLTGELGTVTVTVTAPASLNYLEDSEQITFEVNDKQRQTITFSVGDQTYGGEVSLAGESDSNLPVSYEIVSGPLAITNGILSFTGVGDAKIKAVQGGDEVYNEAEPVEITFSVIQAPLKVTANDASIVYSEDLPELSFSYDGFVYNETAAVLSEIPVASTLATANSDAGIYDISLSGGVAENYALTLVDGTLTIEKATATITLSDLTYDEDGTAKSPTVVTDPAELEVVLTYDGESAAPSAAGSYEIVATIDETNYLGSATTTLTINEVAVTGVQPKAVEIAVYPNPTSDWLAVSGLTDKLAQLSLIDIDGHVVLSEIVTPKQRINVKSLKAGLYLLQLEQKDLTTTTKILIH
ncbi:MBG domain-containing protein [Reichenbachiella sp.]|uniref:MBG domain-containing protein n=1 Tax=Reichenbachiella sp. TaxID=2184521 RepID=UPI003B5CE317